MSTLSGFIDVPGARLYFEAAGSGTPFVMVHAGIADSSMWDPQFDFFARTHRVIRYDTRGFGKTTMEDAPFANRDDLRAVLDHLNAPKAIVMGCSRGGSIALDFSVAHPDRALALVHVCGGVSGFDGGGAVFPEQVQSIENAIQAAEHTKDWEAAADLQVQLWADGWDQPAGRAARHVREHMKRMVIHNYRNRHTEGSPQPLSPPAVGRAADLAIPALVFITEHDEPYTIAAGEYLAATIPDAQRVKFFNCAHVPSMEQPHRFNQVLAEFLNRHDL